MEEISACTAEIVVDTGYYWKEICVDNCPPGFMTAEGRPPVIKRWRVNRALWEAKDTRPLCEDACPDCGGELRKESWDTVWPWICQSCKKRWEYR